MQTLVYDGSFEGWLCAVFDVYEYKFADPDITTSERFNGNLFGTVHTVHTEAAHSDRVWKGLQKRLTIEALDQVRYAFLSEEPGMENILLRYVQYAFASPVSMEKDFSHADVLAVVQTARKVWKERHRMEAFVRFQKTADGLFYAVIEPDHNVLPLIAPHFTGRYADQQWLIYDRRRKWGLYYNGQETAEVQVDFRPEAAAGGPAVLPIFDEKEPLYQELWKQYFTSVNIPARKNLRLQVQHMPRRYWRFLTEKTPGF